MSRGLGPEPSIFCCDLEGACASTQVALSCLEVSKLQLNFISPRSSQALQPSIAGPGNLVALEVISLMLPF